LAEGSVQTSQAGFGMYGDAQTQRWAGRSFNVPLFRAPFRPHHDGMRRSVGDLIRSMTPGASDIQSGDMVGRHRTMEMRMELMRGPMEILMDR
jgi:hypothetical protein